MARVSLLDTVWDVVEIDGRPADVATGTPRPHLVLGTEGNRASGLAGCNRFTARFEQGAGGFRFAALATTRMACEDPVMARESAMLAALEATRSQRVVGVVLELRDASGAVRLRLEARPAP